MTIRLLRVFQQSANSVFSGRKRENVCGQLPETTGSGGAIACPSGTARRMDGYETLWVPGTDHASLQTPPVGQAGGRTCLNHCFLEI